MTPILGEGTLVVWKMTAAGLFHLVSMRQEESIDDDERSARFPI
jgi:hypothetical protein